jgi:hypothetical protein
MLSVQTSQEHIREKEQQDAPLSNYSLQLNYPLHVSNKQVFLYMQHVVFLMLQWGV